ncbi:hypothetical protein HJP15_04485 [Pseudoalteromonas sp. NEC-BIFX-2020_002]|uniref:sulfotransferase n=1 Tax=unclassified Pseudoalteromonas TaxID=194690 RepID=UPI001477106D|nr:sulfotransferase [Pseudoalteromonas sp. NEC-BIFX-2020_002]NNG42208.1 hypothetical protein [Pseudoalteromonas sp. NEC-BIFX-2020_002]
MNFKVAVGVCYGRGGSFFLHSLLDGHPEVISLPPYMMNLAQHIFNTADLENKEFTEQFILDFNNLFVESYSQCVSNQYINFNNNMARTQTGLLNLDKKKFKEALILELENKPKAFNIRFIAIHIIIYQLLGINTSDKKVIFYQLHTPNYTVMRKMYDEFNHLLVCHSVRDPIASFIRMSLAHCNDLQKLPDYEISLGRSTVESCFRHFLYAGSDLTGCENSKSLAIKLEQLHATPQQTLQLVTSFLQIGWHDILLAETINHGQNWQGIIGDTTGFNLEKTLNNNRKYRSYVDEYDLIRLEKIARQRFLKWEYPLQYEDITEKLDFEKPYAFETFSLTVSNKNKNLTDRNVDADITVCRGELHTAILKTINYMPEQFGAFTSISTNE